MSDKETVMSSRLNRDERADVRWWAGYAFRWILAGIVLLFALSAFTLAVWTPWARDRQADIIRRSSGFQTTNEETILRKVTEFERLTDGGQRAAVLDEICRLASRGHNGNDSIDQFTDTYC